MRCSEPGHLAVLEVDIVRHYRDTESRQRERSPKTTDAESLALLGEFLLPPTSSRSGTEKLSPEGKKLLDEWKAGIRRD